MMKNKALLTFCAVIMGSASMATAQLNQWRLNEIVTRTNDATDADRSQFIELHHPNQGESVTGLSIVVIRPLFVTGEPNAGPFRFAYREDLTGSAAGGSNFFVLGNQNYATNHGGQNQISTTNPLFLRPGGGAQGQYQEVLLVPTSAIDAGWTVANTAAGYQFQASDFNNGADIIDRVYLVGFSSLGDPLEDGRFVSMASPNPQQYISNPDFAASGPIGGNRVADGTGDWLAFTTALHINPDGPATQQLPSASTPGASNTWTDVSDWLLY